MPELSSYQLRKLRKSARQIKQLNAAYDAYQDALRRRQHGDVATARLEAAVARVLGRSRYEFERPTKSNGHKHKDKASPK